MIRSIATVLGLITAIFIAACESAPKATGMNSALDDYNGRRFSAAHQKAVQTQEKATLPAAREDAAYVAGISAYQMGDLNEAESRLLTASRSNNPETSAKAKAMLGQIRMDQRRPRDAAALFAEAAPNLASEDSKRCSYSAAVAYQQAGEAEKSRQWLTRSGQTAPASSSTVSASPSSVPVARNSASAAPSGKPAFALQVGAFREKQRAQQAADEVEKLAEREGLGAVRIITKRDQRDTMYIVQFGSFVTRDSAAAVRSRLGRLQYVVTPYAGN